MAVQSHKNMTTKSVYIYTCTLFNHVDSSIQLQPACCLSSLFWSFVNHTDTVPLTVALLLVLSLTCYVSLGKGNSDTSGLCVLTSATSSNAADVRFPHFRHDLDRWSQLCKTAFQNWKAPPNSRQKRPRYKRPLVFLDTRDVVVVTSREAPLTKLQADRRKV